VLILDKLFVQNKISRRVFLKYSASIAVLLGLSEMYVPQIARALESVATGKQPVIWLHGAECTGCTVSFANSNYPDVSELVLDLLSVQYHETLMAGSGDVAERALQRAIDQYSGKYILIVEGAVPTKDNGIYCRIGGKTFLSIVQNAASGAAYKVAVGTCASFGGIPAAGDNPTGCKGLKDVVGGAVINIPGCPPHPDWIVGTIVSLLLFGRIPELDKYGRPKIFYGKLIHENCPRRGGYEQGEFIKKFGEELPNIDGCLGAKGCRGPVASADCPQRLWNSGVNFCIASNAPCAGCVEPTFPQFPLYEPIPEVAKVLAHETEDKTSENGIGITLGSAVAGAVAAAGATYYLTQKAREKEGGNNGPNCSN